MLHGVVAGAWATWVGWWHLHRQLLKAARFVRNAALGKAWRSWKQAHLLCKVAKAATQYTRNLLAKSVAKLAANVADAKSARKSTRTAMLFAFGKVSARYFDIWRRAARVLPVARRLRARVFARAAYGCLIGWRDFSRQRSMLLAKGQRLQASLGVNTLARLYGLWRTLYRVRVYMGEYNATRAFGAWRNHVAGARARALRYDGIFAEMLMGNRRRVFIGWFALMVELREARAVFQEKQRRLRQAVRYGDLMARRRRFQTMLGQVRVMCLGISAWVSD